MSKQDEAEFGLVAYPPDAMKNSVRRGHLKAWAARHGAVALAAFATGAVAVGALAIGTLAIGRLTVGRARIGTLVIDNLILGKRLDPE